MAKPLMQRVTVVDLKDSTTQTIYKAGGKDKRKRVSKWLRPTERLVRKALKAQHRYWTEALSRHEKSRTKKRDRWLTDSLNNNLRAMDKGLRVWRRS